MQNHKVVLCGEIMVGKSAIFNAVQKKQFAEELPTTIAATFAQVRVNVNDQQVKL